jgi:hypothetical protein
MANETKTQGVVWRVEIAFQRDVLTAKVIEIPLETVYLPSLTLRSIILLKVAVGKFVENLRQQRKEAWIAGSISMDQLANLRQTGVDVICVRGAACEQLEGEGQFGLVSKQIVRELFLTIPV